MTLARRGDKRMAVPSPAWVYSMIQALSRLTSALRRYGSMDGLPSDATTEQAGGRKNVDATMPASTDISWNVCPECRGAAAPPRYEPVGCTFSGAAGWTKRTSFQAQRGSGKADLGSATRWGQRPSYGGTVTLLATSGDHAHAIRGPRTFSDIASSCIHEYGREGVNT